MNLNVAATQGLIEEIKILSSYIFCSNIFFFFFCFDIYEKHI